MSLNDPGMLCKLTKINLERIVNKSKKALNELWMKLNWPWTNIINPTEDYLVLFRFYVALIGLVYAYLALFELPWA